MAQELTGLQRFALQHCARLALDYIRAHKFGATNNTIANLRHCAIAHLRQQLIELPRKFDPLTQQNARKFRAWCLSQLNRSSSQTTTQQ